jgi:hypothetical protein
VLNPHENVGRGIYRVGLGFAAANMADVTAAQKEIRMGVRFFLEIAWCLDIIQHDAQTGG